MLQPIWLRLLRALGQPHGHSVVGINCFFLSCFVWVGSLSQSFIICIKTPSFGLTSSACIIILEVIEHATMIVNRPIPSWIRCSRPQKSSSSIITLGKVALTRPVNILRGRHVELLVCMWPCLAQATVCRPAWRGVHSSCYKMATIGLSVSDLDRCCSSRTHYHRFWRSRSDDDHAALLGSAGNLMAGRRQSSVDNGPIQSIPWTKGHCRSG
jgi:hypothetical protein